MTRAVLIGILVVAAFLSGIISFQRFLVENDNKTVELIADYQAFAQLAEADLTSENIFASLREVGITSLSLENNLDEGIVNKLKQKGFRLVPRIKLGSDNIVIDDFAKQAGDFDQLIIISSQTGNKLPQELISLDKFLLNSSVKIGIVEFYEPLDVDKIAFGHNAIRVHEIRGPEMNKLSDERGLARYLRAVRERNIRILVIHPFENLERSLHLVESLKASLVDEGFQLGIAQPFGPWQPSPYWLWPISLGVIAGMLLLLQNFFIIPARWVWALMIGTGLVGGLLICQSMIFSQQIFALVAAIVFPVLGVITAFDSKNREKLGYLIGGLVSLAGAFLIVGLLSGTNFLVKLALFRGVKLMHIVPIALAFIFGTFEKLPLESLCQIKPILMDRLRRLASVRTLITIGVAGLVATIYILRTDNFVLPVPNFELVLREELERILYVRPRLKEFLFGHPVLFLTLRTKRKHPLLFAAAVVGQLSLVNTFTHIHTPIILSLLRSFYGLVLGCLIGYILWVIYFKLKGRCGYDPRFRLLRF